MVKKLHVLRCAIGRLTNWRNCNLTCILPYIHDLLFRNPSCELANDWSRARNGVSCGSTMSNIDIWNRDFNSCSLKRLRHNIIVSNADSLAFISGRPTILRCIDNCSAESARWISQSLPLVLTGHSGVTRAVANFYPLTGEGHRKTWHKIAGCSKSRPVISPVYSLRRHCWRH